MLRSFEFDFQLQCCRESVGNKREEFWLVFKKPAVSDHPKANVIYSGPGSQTGTFGSADTLIKNFSYDEDTFALKENEELVLQNTSVITIFEYS